MAKQQVKPRDFVLLDDPVWCFEQASYDCDSVRHSGLKFSPSPLILNIWKLVARAKYGREDATLQVAKDLGYIAEYHDPDSGECVMDLTRFDYDPDEIRSQIGLSADMPLVFVKEGTRCSVRSILNRLLGDEGV